MSMTAEELAALSGAYDSGNTLKMKEIENNYKLGSAQIKASMANAKTAAGASRYATDESREYHRGLLKQAEAEMREIGIPDMLIRKYVAEKNYEIASGELALKKESFEFDKAKFAQEFGLSEADVTGYYKDAATLEREQFGQDVIEQNRRYALDVGKFGAELASTPDTYFQARRFQAVTAPRLLGQPGGGVTPGSTAPAGAPTPGVATMGAYLSGTDPYGAGASTAAASNAPAYGGPAAGSPAVSAAPAAATQAAGAATAPPAGNYGILTLMADNGMTFEQAQQAYAALSPDRQAIANTRGQQVGAANPQLAQQVDQRAKQLAAIVKASPPSPYEGLDESDTATLKLMESVYKRGGQGIAGGEYERMKANNSLPFLQSAGRLLGYDPKDLEAQYMAYRPAQGSASSAG